MRKAAEQLGIGAKDGGKPKQVMQLARECHAYLMSGGGGSGDGSPAQSYTRAIPSLLPGGPNPAPKHAVRAGAAVTPGACVNTRSIARYYGSSNA